MIFKKIRKGYADWRNFLCSTPARDYVFQKDAYEDQIDRAAKNIRNTDCVIIGAGAGASTAAGIQYGGKRFTDNFAAAMRNMSVIYIWIKSSFPFCVQPAGKSQNCFKRCYGTGKRKYPQS